MEPYVPDRIRLLIASATKGIPRDAVNIPNLLSLVTNAPVSKLVVTTPNWTV